MSKSGVLSRLRLERLLGSPSESLPGVSAAKDVIEGLRANPKTLPAIYFYDDRGSELFEQICQLPEYYPTRTEAKILTESAKAIAKITGACEIVELGSGSSVKTRILLDAYRDCGLPLYYLPTDISGGILASSAAALIEDYPDLKVHALVGTYAQALAYLGSADVGLVQRSQRMICFLGSSIGNFNPAEFSLFIGQVAQAMQPGEYFLLGVDLQKSAAILEPAYSDRQGITAAFNLNMLAHLNQKFNGDFDLQQFKHHAFYNLEENQIEMHLRSKIAQRVTLQIGNENHHFSFLAGETIQTEISRKFNLDQLCDQLAEVGLNKVEIWTDSNQWFGLILAQLAFN
jgi:L-histidine Nalpha-methyltransferase